MHQLRIGVPVHENAFNWVLGLHGRTAVVTGGSKGIGFAIAKELAREGVDLHLAARSIPDLEKAAADLASRFGVHVEAHPVDLSDRDARDAFAHKCAHVDILVNCAGAIPGGGLDQVDEDAWRRAWDLKLFGYVGITRIIYKEMCRRRRGVIINVVGAGGISTSAGYICGGANNAALINFTISLGGTSVRHGVRVCGVNPGPVDTERMSYLRRIDEENVPPSERDAWAKTYYGRMAYGRAARPDEVSGMVAFLASDRASYISGAMLTIDGGTVARAGALGDFVDCAGNGDSRVTTRGADAMKGFAGYGADTCDIDPRRSAVLAIHWQVDVIDPGGAFGAVFSQAIAESGVISRTSDMLQQARLAGCRIIYVNIVYRPGYSGIVQNNALFRKAADSKGFIQGTRGVEVIDALRPRPADIVIDHSRSSAFFGSDLLTILVGFGIETVAISGIATNVAVDHTARDAMQYGFNTILIEDCCFSSDPEHHDAALVTMQILCSGVMKGDDFVMLLGKGAGRERPQ